LALPWLQITLSAEGIALIISARPGLDTLRWHIAIPSRITGKLIHQLLREVNQKFPKAQGLTRAYLIFPVNSIATTNAFLRCTEATRNFVSSIRPTLSLGTIASHMASITANATDDVGGEVALLRTVVFAMTDLST